MTVTSCENCPLHREIRGTDGACLHPHASAELECHAGPAPELCPLRVGGLTIEIAP